MNYKMKPQYYRKHITKNLVKKTMKVFVLLPMKKTPHECELCKSFNSNVLIKHTVDHDLYHCLTKFMILEYIQITEDDKNLGRYLERKWSKLGPKLTQEFKRMDSDSCGECTQQRESIPICYR
tara:strand:+ start:2628 stop:2996 length:369 start_codon:yes stop_codon:yes gene_type:complete